MSKLSGRPLLDNAADARLYVPAQPAYERLYRAARRNLNALLLGERGAGKTSLLRHLALNLREESDNRVVFVDVGAFNDVVGVTEEIRSALGRPRTLGEAFSQSMRSMARPVSATSRDASYLLDLLSELRNDQPALVLVDGITDPGIAHTLFGRLRDELWELPYTWIVSADSSQKGAILTPPADAFFDMNVEIDPMSREDQIDMLARRLGPDEDVTPSQLVELFTDGNPRRLLAATREAIVDQLRPEDIHQTAMSRKTAASSLGRSPSMVLSELENLGRPVAASDAELLARIGVTRERMVQVLNQLEKARIVESFPETGSVRGRPRKLYRIRNDRAWEPEGE